MCVVDSMGVRFFVEVHTEIKSKCVHMVRCSYVGQFEVRAHGKVGTLVCFTVIRVGVLSSFNFKG